MQNYGSRKIEIEVSWSWRSSFSDVWEFFKEMNAETCI